MLREVELCKGPAELHTAKEGEENSTVESVANIGSTHVVGHQVSTPTMKIVNGVVQGENHRVKMRKFSTVTFMKPSLLDYFVIGLPI